MKWKLIRMLGLFFLETSCYPLHAQDSTVSKILPPVIVTATTTKVPEKVWDSFGTYFNGAFVRKWYKINKRYLAKFMLDEKVNRALFTAKGQLVYYISYGYENSLPENLHEQVKNAYPGFIIAKAVRVSEDNRIIWVVTLENQDLLILVRLENNELEEVQHLEKN